MTEFDVFIGVLEKSIEKNGETKPLTLGHAMNIAKLSKKLYIKYKDADNERQMKIWDEASNDLRDNQYTN